jgi:hypothetical protein
MQRSESLRGTVLAAVAIAAVLSLIVVAIGVVAAVVYLAKHGMGALLSASPAALGAGLIIIGSYFAAALIAAPVYHAIVPLARWLPGEMLVAAVLGFIVYGTVGLTAVLAYVNVGINIIGYDSPSAAWRSLLPMASVLAAFTGLMGPPIWRSWSRRA